MGGRNRRDLSQATTYKLKANRGRKGCRAGDHLPGGLDDNTLVLDIVCQEPNMNQLVVADQVFDGDYLAVSLETPTHAYYHLDINPDGRIAEGNPSGDWKSLAEVKTEKGADFWRVQLRIPVVGEVEADSDPKHYVAGAKPTKEAPWFFNIGRLRMAGLEVPEQQVSPQPAPLGTCLQNSGSSKSNEAGSPGTGRRNAARPIILLLQQI